MSRPQIRHRGWLIEESIEGFEATHPDFDLDAGDDRFVVAETLGDLAEAIERWIEEHDE